MRDQLNTEECLQDFVMARVHKESKEFPKVLQNAEENEENYFTRQFYTYTYLLFISLLSGKL